ncbi:MAG: co-chaperone GroES [Candidatus Paceibacterota bacterium]
MAKQTNALSIVPLADRVIVAPAVGGETSASGIIIPDTARREKPEKGTVVAVGPGKYDDGVLVPMTVKVGDTVLFSPYGGFDEIKVDGQEYFVISESSILAILKA